MQVFRVGSSRHDGVEAGVDDDVVDERFEVFCVAEECVDVDGIPGLSWRWIVLWSDGPGWCPFRSTKEH